MKPKQSLLFTALSAFFVLTFLSSCAENPADGVAEAEVNEAGGNPVSGDAVAPSAADPQGIAAEGKKFVFADGSTIKFEGSKVTGSHEGGFNKFEGYVTVSGDQLVGTDHQVLIDMHSTWADDPKLEGHLKSGDFFDVENHPLSTFVLKTIEKGEGPQYTLTGDFNFHGVTKSISFPAEITGTGDAGPFQLKAEFFIKRFDFNIKYPGKADDLIRDEVVIRLDLIAEPS